jgi:hypothetical protein
MAYNFCWIEEFALISLVVTIYEDDNSMVSLPSSVKFSYSFPFPFVPLQRWGTFVSMNRFSTLCG